VKTIPNVQYESPEKYLLKIINFLDTNNEVPPPKSAKQKCALKRIITFVYTFDKYFPIASINEEHLEEKFKQWILDYNFIGCLAPEEKFQTRFNQIGYGYFISPVRLPNYNSFMIIPNNTFTENEVKTLATLNDKTITCVIMAKLIGLEYVPTPKELAILLKLQA
jgi:hypothetical protein